MIPTGGCAANRAIKQARDVLGDLGLDAGEIIDGAMDEDSEYIDIDDSMYNYQGPLYDSSFTGVKEVDLLSWAGFPEEVILPGGIIDPILAVIWDETEDKTTYHLSLTTGGAPYYEIADWYKEQLEKGGWALRYQVVSAAKHNRIL